MKKVLIFTISIAVFIANTYAQFAAKRTECNNRTIQGFL